MSDQSHWVEFEQAKENYMNLEEFKAELRNHRKKWFFPIEFAYYRVYNFLTEIPSQLRWFQQRVTRGFDDRDMWGLDTAITAFVYPRIKFFNKWQKEHGMGVPADFEKNPAEWLEVLNKIELAFEHMAKDNFLCGFGTKDFHSVPDKDAFKDPADFEQAMKEWRRRSDVIAQEIETGLDLFRKYYHGLWD